MKKSYKKGEQNSTFINIYPGLCSECMRNTASTLKNEITKSKIRMPLVGMKRNVHTTANT